MRLHQLTESSLPLVKHQELYHTGTMDKGKKNKHSHEGTGLSVTVKHAVQSWIRLARASGDTWQLTKQDGSFVDAHAISDNQHKMITGWAINQGYAEQQSLYIVSYFDDEMDDTMIMTFDNYEEAQEEAAGFDMDDDEIETKSDGIIATVKLEQRIGNKVEPTMLPDILLTIYTEDTTNFDGVWWEDDHDVSRYSAPRGVIFNSKVPSWHKEVT